MGFLIVIIMASGLCGHSYIEETIRVEPRFCIKQLTPEGHNQVNDHPFIEIFCAPGMSMNPAMMIVITQDGTIIWSKTQWEGGSPYFQAKLTTAQMAKLRKELKFIELVNYHIKYIPNHRRPPDYSMGVMNIIDDDNTMLSIHLVERASSLDFSMPFKTQSERRKQLDSMIHLNKALTDEQQKQYADYLWDIIVEILKDYIPESGTEIKDSNFNIAVSGYSFYAKN